MEAFSAGGAVEALLDLGPGFAEAIRVEADLGMLFGIAEIALRVQPQLVAERAEDLSPLYAQDAAMVLKHV